MLKQLLTTLMLTFLALPLMAQVKVTGKVTDENNSPLPGATVIIKGSAKGVATDFNGNYEIEAQVGNELEFSFMGFQTQTKKVMGGGKTLIINVLLREDAEQLEDVVVVGYGTQRKESLTGAMQTLKQEKLTDITSPTIENMISGKVSGVFVAPGSGRPGETGAIIIRGKSTINGSTAPLWVVDGVIMGTGANIVNPADIETMSILKDAASTAIYGSQGANGVILVTTKKAVTGELKTQISIKQGLTSLNNGNLQVMNGAELYDYFQSFSNASTISAPRWNLELRNSNFDWWEEATRAGFVRDYTASISGGSDMLRSYFSVGFYSEQGAVKGYEYDKYDFRLKTDYTPVKWLTIKPNVTGSFRQSDDKQHSVGAMYSNLPWDSPYDEEGNLVPHRSPRWFNSNSTNYLYDLQWNHSKGSSFQGMGGLDFTIRFYDWLTFSSINNYRLSTYHSNSYSDPRSSAGESVKGRLYEYQSNVINRYTSQILNFNKSFDNHSFDATLVYEYKDYWGKVISAQGVGFIPGFEVLDVVTKPESTKGSLTESATQSLISKFVYNYASRYILEGSLRRDGASNFGANARYGNFFSVSGSWNVHNEEWFTPEWVNSLKLRASYGSVGIQPNVLYGQYDLYAVSTGASYNQISGALISQKGNKDLTWETTYTTGLGFDATLFDRVSLTVDFYDKAISNLLYPVPVSGVTGVTSVWRNVGELSNKGIEITLGASIIKNEDIHWEVDLNFGKNTNEIKNLYGDRKEIIVSDGAGIAGSANKILKPGYDSDTFYMREWAGVDKETGAPLWYKSVTDANGNVTREVTKKYSEANQVDVGKATPDFFGGFGTAFTYKNFDLRANFGFAYGGKIYNYSRTEYDSDGAYTDRNQMKLMSGWSRWQKPGDDATHPKATYENKSNSNKVSSRFLEDGSYLKLRSLSIGYNLDLSEYKLPKLRLSISGENLFTITNYSGVDPEIPTRNGAIINSSGPSVYPSTRKFIFGITANF
ncbi:TonB-dependent receptor [Capnocytophaga sp. H2931]|uniref:SusC/RagA family TonB-linked outer membrane protein n=1 Tax=Capnocytophaga sp. H2931 TaxID=1945657 RepID=UPI000BB1C22A|nr:TonB-dependent receptor [Capnocytophaga sp. H2931]ATA74489.1 SusC/RagA family protein [Capnocytophaga sp. H2931]